MTGNLGLLADPGYSYWKCKINIPFCQLINNLPHSEMFEQLWLPHDVGDIHKHIWLTYVAKWNEIILECTVLNNWVLIIIIILIIFKGNVPKESTSIPKYWMKQPSYFSLAIDSGVWGADEVELLLLVLPLLVRSFCLLGYIADLSFCVSVTSSLLIILFQSFVFWHPAW